MEKKLIKVVTGLGAGYAGWKAIDNRYQVSRDIAMLKKLSGMKQGQKEARDNGLLFTDLWYRTLSKVKNKTAILYEDESYTFQEVEELSNQVANWLLSKGVKPGDTVALLMENRPEFLIYELGISKIGVEVALINTSIKQKGLVHCVKISGCKVLLFGTELQHNVQEVQNEFADVDVLLYGEGKETCFTNQANNEVSSFSKEAVDKKLRKGLHYMSTFGYIYTSGTTGLPKAAIIIHQKYHGFALMMKYGYDVNEDDVVYSCLPLFHSAGGGLGASLMFIVGCTFATRKKFSATNFFADCMKYKATVTQYIGELCRYLLLAPESQYDRKHTVRIAIGNGLRPEIWDEFQERFNIPEIGEFYGATEGNGALINHCKTPETRGACGQAGALLRKLQGAKIVKFDVVSEEPVRDSNTGKCVECAFDEPGELLFPITADPGTAFVGYKNKKATAKKIIDNVLVDGDKYFRTGDLLTISKNGLYKFVDRIGDTFRWKGENCSTTEVTEVFATFPGIAEVNVYGVQIPNNLDGRAPTAGITPVDGDMNNLDLKKLAEYAKEQLPSYAVPVFIRIIPQVAVTATMKHQKVKLRQEGIQLDKITDDLYWLNPQSKEYEPFGEEEFKIVTQGQAKL